MQNLDIREVCIHPSVECTVYPELYPETWNHSRGIYGVAEKIAMIRNHERARLPNFLARLPQDYPDSFVSSHRKVPESRTTSA